MSQLHIIKASAGSGKTFSLTREFLRLVLTEPIDYYKHILAVTFTNKATSEMKSRILLELFLLGSNLESAHLAGLLEYLPNKTESQIRTKSNAILKQILHGYSWFRIETIDSFFQGVIRSFIREIGVPGNYNVEIDQSKILENAVDNFLDNLGNSTHSLKWVLEYIENKIEEGKSWVVNAEIQDLGRHLFNENVIDKSEYLEKFLGNEEVLKAFRDVLIAQIKSFEQNIVQTAGKATSILEQAGLTEDDFFQGNRGPYGFFVKNANGNLTVPNSYVIKVLENPDKWASGKSKRKDEVQITGENKLYPILVSITNCFNEEGEAYETAKLILKNYHILGLIYLLRNEIDQIKQDKGIMLISDAAPFIRKIINGNDIPFVYEKIGTQFNHLLIDEFQDTSRMQWDNFKPLLSNCLSGNNKCLVVGDVKQSIYRWRNSEWEILARKIKESFNKEFLFEEELDTNRRSCGNIVKFNNNFFSESIKVIETLITNQPEDMVSLSGIYENVVQKVPESAKANEGAVYFKFFDEDVVSQDDTYFEEEIIRKINEALKLNYLPGDITFLVRTKSEGSVLARFLVEANKEKLFIQDVGVISNESLFLIQSPVIKLLVAAMKYIYDPCEKIIAAEFIACYLQVYSENKQSVIFPSGEFELHEIGNTIDKNFYDLHKELKISGLYDVVEKLCSLLNLYNQETELVYLHSFLDVVYDYSSKETADLGGFLKYFNEEGAKKTISAAETNSSLKILTIHKSKGLQFPIVIIPFADWRYTPMNNETIWVESENEPFNKLPLIPVNYSERLSKSQFKKDYYKELYLSLIDNLNLLYVAFTRAEDALICLAKKSENKVKTLGDILFKTINSISSSEIMAFRADQDEQSFSTGILPGKPTQALTAETDLMKNTIVAGYIPKVKISRQAREFMRRKENKEDAAAVGRIFHAIMEKIKTATDIEPAIKSMQMQGVINQEEAEDMSIQLKEAFEKSRVEEWFSENNKVLTEIDIIGSSGKIHRPDRVIMQEDKVVVVDYKFGSEDEKEKHINQVLSYMGLVNNMGFPVVKGYIWYVLEHNVVEVGI
jgi:ATP-dependent exoDNAse (exonuclease V) beta subunit